MEFLMTALLGIIAFVCMIVGGMVLGLCLCSSEYRSLRTTKFSLTALSVSLCMSLVLLHLPH